MEENKEIVVEEPVEETEETTEEQTPVEEIVDLGVEYPEDEITEEE